MLLLYNETLTSRVLIFQQKKHVLCVKVVPVHLKNTRILIFPS